MAQNNSQSEVLSVHNVIQCCNVLEGTFKMASSLKGALYRKKLLPVTCSPETVSKKTESELPMELTEEYVGDTDSVSSEDSFGFSLSQSTAKLPVKLAGKCPPKCCRCRIRPEQDRIRLVVFSMVLFITFLFYLNS